MSIEIELKEEGAGPPSASLKDIEQIANRLNVSNEKAIHIAIHRLWISLFSNAKDFDYPTEEELKNIDREAEREIEEGLKTGETQVGDSLFRRIGLGD